MKGKLLILLTSICLSSCKIYDIKEQLDNRDPNGRPIIQFTPKEGIPANGISEMEIKVLFPVAPSPDFAKVSFTTNEGVFIENNKSEFTSSILRLDRATDKLYIRATLKSTTSKGEHKIKIEIPEVVIKDTVVTFLPAYPVAVTTDKNKFAVAKTSKDEIQLFANLTSDRGVPHKGTEVIFKVIVNSVIYSTDNPQTKHLFRALTKTDSNGQAFVFFTPGDNIVDLGQARYEVTALKADGALLSPAIGTFNVVVPE